MCMHLHSAKLCNNGHLGPERIALNHHKLGDMKDELHCSLSDMQGKSPLFD
jgi:hypothetical protein